MQTILKNSSSLLVCLIAVCAWMLVDTAEAGSGNYLAPKAFRAAVERVRPSLVTIEAYGGVDKRARGRRRRGQARGISKPGEGPTTGLLISSEGHIITSTFNFVREQPVITVVLADDSQHVAKIIGRDDMRKICVLKIETDQKLEVPEFVKESELQVGQWAISVGAGFGGQELAMSTGVLSATNRIFGRAIQTDANISPANYGGPLLDIEGRVMGICVPLSPRSQATTGGVEWYDSGIGFAIPIAGNDRIIEELKAGKTIKPGKMGVMPARGEIKGGGVKIQTVQKDSAADKAGLKKDDVIVKINDREVKDLHILRSIMGRFIAADEIKVVVKRGEEEKTFPLKLEEGNDQPNPANRRRPVPRRRRR